MRILSGIQPSLLHIGNYFGAMRQWLDLQKHHDCFFCIVDLHAMTSTYTASLHTLSLETAALYMACGLDQEKATIFVQSAVPQHTELFWLLSTKTPVGWLNRMTQFKSNTIKEPSLGLYTYPVLMAADILLYRATHVPVGEDQKQHLEFARDLAIRCNTLCQKDIFVVPEPIIPKSGARIMSLKDGTAKMSKSDPSEASRITLTDSNDAIAHKIQKAKTDSLPLPETPQDLVGRPEMHNLYTILAHTSNTNEQDLYRNVRSCKQLKELLIDALTTFLTPIRTSYQKLSCDKAYMTSVLNTHAEKARATAEKHYNTVLSTFLHM